MAVLWLQTGVTTMALDISAYIEYVASWIDRQSESIDGQVSEQESEGLIQTTPELLLGL